MFPTLRIRRAALAAGLALAALPAAASADSIVFIKDANVWLAHGDGTGQYQVTLDGTAQQPYRVPVQADDGTIVASHRDEIVRMRQNGAVLNTIDPDPLINSVGHPVDGPPVNLAVSPDGTRIAYSLVGYECPVGADCMARAVTAFTAADALTPAAQWGSLHRGNPSFVSNTRVARVRRLRRPGQRPRPRRPGRDPLVRRPRRLRPGRRHRPRRRRAQPPGHAARGDPQLRARSAPHLVLGRRRRGRRQAARRCRRRSARADRRRDSPGRRGRPTATGSRSPRPTASGRWAPRPTAPPPPPRS